MKNEAIVAKLVAAIALLSEILVELKSARPAPVFSVLSSNVGDEDLHEGD